jgi:putative DNA primase/helicase
MDFLTVALEYASRGWYILPLKPRDKIPLTKHGVKDATTDPDTIRRWWAQWPDANIGIACGPSRLVVVDLDGPEALAAWGDLALRYNIRYDTLTAHTGGGGFHLIYRAPDGLRIGNSSGKLGPHIDTRGDGGYIVAPPSIHPSGETYTWENPEREILPLPQVLIDLLTRQGRETPPPAPPPPPARDLSPYAEAALREEVETVRSAPIGTRNDTLNRAAFNLGQLVGAGLLDRTTVEAELTRAAMEAGLEEREIEKTVRSGLEAGMRQPRTIPERPTPMAASPSPQGDPGEIRLEALTIGMEAWFGRLAADLLPDRLRYVSAWGWTVWDGKCWRRDDGQARAITLRTLTEAVAERAVKEESTEKRKELFEAGARIQNRTRLDNAMVFAQGWLLSRLEQFDQHPTLLNTQNGVVDLTTGDLLPHRPDLYLTQITTVPYDPGATCPRFEAFLTEIFAYNDRLVAYIQRLLGYALLGHNNERVFAIFWGHGRNGKSTLIGILAGVLGDYLREARPESFESLRPGEVRPRNDLAVLRNARLVTVNESREGARFDPALIKQIAGGDLITVRFLYREDFNYRPGFLPILRTNFKPSFPGGDPALWDRIRLIPFTVQIPPERQVKDLAARILQAEGTGVLAWLIRGCLEYQRIGLDDPPEVLEATAQYRGETDPIWAFIQENCVIEETAREEAGKLYEAYRQWCEAQGIEAKSQQAFGRMLSHLGFDAYHERKGRWRVGLALKRDG